MHIAVSPISKATVNGYLGREIPNSEALGLEPERLYQLLRHPEELRKAAPTFNHLPLLNQHRPFSAEDHDKKLIVGWTGNNAHFDGRYLKNSLVILDAVAIDGVKQDLQREISSAYRYVADMTPGIYKGLRYDGVMRDIVGNHVALVEAGRAGSDVLVEDAKLEFEPMAKALNSRSAILLHGALTTYLTPLLAMDARPDITPAISKVTAANFGKSAKSIVSGITKIVTPHLAADADLETLMEVVEAIAPLVEGTAETDDLSVDMDPDDGAMDNEGLKAFLKGKLSDEDHAKACSMMGGGNANDADPDPEPDMKDKKDDKRAMDSRLRRLETDITDRVTTQVRAEASALRDAEKAVKPYVGEVAMDSAQAVYCFALDSLKVDYDKDLPVKALAAILKAQLVPGTENKRGGSPFAMDASPDLSKRFTTMFGPAA